MSVEVDFSFHLETNDSWDLEGECRKILNEYPLFSIAGAAGKFTANYAVWAFDISSPLPLVEKVREIFSRNKEKLGARLGIEPRIDLIRMSYSPNQSKEISLWHKDGLYWNGQLHWTVKGGARIAISQKEDLQAGSNYELIEKKMGDFWYLNSTQYLHKVLPSDSTEDRIEITMPVNIPKEYLDYYRRHFSDYKDGCYIYTEEIDSLIRYNQDSRKNKKWSSDNTPKNNEVVYTSDFLQPDRLYFLKDYLDIYANTGC